VTIEQMFEGISAGTPRCECRMDNDVQCPWVSVVRMRTRCDDCGHQSMTFLCKGHRRGLEAREVRCYHCKSSNVWVKVS
jgi:hypothetical protein